MQATIVKQVQKILPSGRTLESFSASNGFAALQLIDEITDGSYFHEIKGFPIIVTDIRMPIMDGFELCRKVRSRHAVTVYSASLAQQSPSERLHLESSLFEVKRRPSSTSRLDLSKFKKVQPLVIGTTSLADDETRAKARRVGFDAIFEIPLSKEHLDEISK